MPLFSKDDTTREPFGVNVYLRSTKNLQFESAMCKASTVPSVTLDGNTEKILQKGVVMAELDAGGVGPFQPGLQVSESVVLAVTATGGTMTLTYDGVATGNIAWNATRDAVRDALEALPGIDAGDLLVTGGPLNTGSVTITFVGGMAARDVANITVQTGSLTGGGATATVTAGAATGTGKATDGRERGENIAGLCNTFLPWQLKEGDREIGVAYTAHAVQAWCLELNAAGTAFQPLSDATRDLIIANDKLNISFA